MVIGNLLGTILVSSLIKVTFETINRNFDPFE